MADTGELAKYGLIGLALYLGYRAMAGVGNTVTAPFEFAGGLVGGAADAGGEVFGGVMNTADNLGDFAGGITGGAGQVVNETLAVPGDLVKTGQGAFDTAVGGTSDVIDSGIGGVQDTADALNPFS